MHISYCCIIFAAVSNADVAKMGNLDAIRHKLGSQLLDTHIAILVYYFE